MGLFQRNTWSINEKPALTKAVTDGLNLYVDKTKRI